MPSVAPVVPVMSGFAYGREWLGAQADPCTGTHGTNGRTAKRSTRHLGRPST
jgi:hypothetical protein